MQAPDGTSLEDCDGSVKKEAVPAGTEERIARMQTLLPALMSINPSLAIPSITHTTATPTAIYTATPSRSHIKIDTCLEPGWGDELPKVVCQLATCLAATEAEAGLEVSPWPLLGTWEDAAAGRSSPWGQASPSPMSGGVKGGEEERGQGQGAGMQVSVQCWDEQEGDLGVGMGLAEGGGFDDFDANMMVEEEVGVQAAIAAQTSPPRHRQHRRQESIVKETVDAVHWASQRPSHTLRSARPGQQAAPTSDTELRCTHTLFSKPADSGQSFYSCQPASSPTFTTTTTANGPGSTHTITPRVK